MCMSRENIGRCPSRRPGTMMSRPYKPASDASRWVVALLVLFLSVAAAHSREAADSLLTQYDTHRQFQVANAFFDALKASGFIDETVHFEADTPPDSVASQVWYWGAEYYCDAQRYAQSLRLALKSLPLLERGNDPLVLGDCLNLLAVNYIRLSDYERAAHYAQRCYRLDCASQDADRISSSLNTLAAIYMAARQPKEAEQYVLRGIGEARKAGNPVRMAVLCGMASEVYHSLGDEVRSLSFATQAYQLEKRLQRPEKAAVRLSQMAAALLWLKHTDVARRALQVAIPQLRAAGNLQSLGIACNQMGGVLLAENQFDRAADYYREAIDLFVKLHDDYNESHARLGLYRALKPSDPAAALAQMERYKELKDSIYDKETAQSMGRYSSELRNDELQAQNLAERAARKRAVCVALLVLAAVLVLAVAVWWAMRRRQVRQQQENRRLHERLEELREKYHQLVVVNDQAGESAESVQAGEEPSEPTFEQQIETVVNQLLDEGTLDVAAVARRMGMSPYRLRQRVQDATGQKPQNLIQSIRLRRACHLLDTQRQLTIAEVGVLCGYADTPNFNRAFKRAMGVTPTQWQNQEPAAGAK